LICFIILSWNDLECQNSESINLANCPREEIDVHFSQESIFSGEILWFRIYCTSSVFPGEEISCLAFIELVSGENTSVIRKKISLVKGEGSGEFEIPANLPTGLYYIVVYTNWMKNFGETSFFIKGIVIVNPYQSFRNTSGGQGSGKTPEQLSSDPVNSGNLKALCDKLKYSTRERVTLKIESAGLQGKKVSGGFSVSVCRKEPAMIRYVGKTRDTVYQDRSEKKLYLPDYRGIRLSGKLTDQSGAAVAYAPLIISFPGPGTDIASTATDSNGAFSILLEPGEGDEDIVITLPDPETKLSLEEPYWNGLRYPPDNMAIDLSGDAVSFLREKFINLQLQNRFKKQFFKRSTPAISRKDSTVFYSMPYQMLYLGNYITLDSLREYFHELVPSVRFTHRRGNADISVIDPQSLTPLEEKPGVFLDGVLYNNYTVIANIPPVEIDRIAILASPYYYKALEFGGIVDIHTKKSDFSVVKPLQNMTRFIYPKAVADELKFVSPDYSDAGFPERIPDFRYLLYWESCIRPDSSGSATIRFYTGDIPGNFVIKVEGMSDDGEIMQLQNEISVE